MKKHTTAQRLKQIMATQNLKQVEVLKAAEPFCKRFNVKLNKNDLSQYVSGKVEPGQEKLSILGLALNVSEAWLMGFDVPIERNVTPTAETGDGHLSEYIELYEMLDGQQKELIISLIKELLSSR